MDIKNMKEKFPWIARVAFLLFIGCFLIILGNSLGERPESKTELSITDQKPNNSLSSMEREIALRLEGTLQQIDGVGSVTVTVFLASGPHYHYALNSTATRRTTEEKDKSGSNRFITEDNTNDQLVVVREGAASTEKPVLLKEDQPQVQGVLVVAEGAASSHIKREMTHLIATLLNIPEYKVTVEPRKGGIYLGSDER